MKSIGVKKSVIPYNPWHNPLDIVMEKYDGMVIQATDVMFEKGIDGNPVLAQEYLENWMKRHSNNYWFVGDRIKISITHRGEDLSNRIIHSKHQQKYQVMK